MRNFKVGVILCLAMVAGCSVSAGIGQGQEPHSVLVQDIDVKHDNFRKVYNSTARVRAYSNGTLQWLGSANSIKRSNGSITYLSNWHVLSGNVEITIEPFVDGYSMGEWPADVLFTTDADGMDMGLATINDDEALMGVEIVPIVDRDVKAGEQIFRVGHSRGEWGSGRLGHIVAVEDKYIFSAPKAIGGDSGSSIFQFDDNNQPMLISLIAWVTHYEGQEVAMSMKAKDILRVIADHKGNKPEYIEPETEIGMLRDLLDRFRRNRDQSDREFKSLRGMIGDLIEQRATLEEKLMQCEIDCQEADKELEILLQEEHDQQEEFNEEIRLFNGKIFGWFLGLSQGQDSIEENQGSITDRLNDSFKSVGVIMGFAKLIFWGMVALLVASLFFKSGFATTALVAIVTFFFRTIKLAYVLIHNAVTKKNENPETLEEALSNLQSGIAVGLGTDSEEIGLKEDAP